MKNKDIIVNQAGQIAILNNEINRLKNIIYELKRCSYEDMKFIGEVIHEMNDTFEKGELTAEKEEEIQRKIIKIINRIRSYLSSSELKSIQDVVNIKDNGTTKNVS